MGIAGGTEKCRYVVNELGLDAAVDYKAEDVMAALRKHCPNGIDVYFDNVGGDILDAALTQIRLGARIVICGGISQYNSTGPIKGPSNYLSLLVNRASMTGMLVTDYGTRYGEAAREMAGWMAAGRLKSREHVVEGFKNFPDTLLKLFTGENIGKLVLKVADAASLRVLRPATLSHRMESFPSTARRAGHQDCRCRCGYQYPARPTRPAPDSCRPACL